MPRRPRRTSPYPRRAALRARRSRAPDPQPQWSYSRLLYPQRAQSMPPQQIEHAGDGRGRREEREGLAFLAELGGCLVEDPEPGDVDEMQVGEVDLDVLALLGLGGNLLGELLDAGGVDVAVHEQP